MPCTRRLERGGITEPYSRLGAVRRARDVNHLLHQVHPALQRAFAWRQDGLLHLFQSLMRGSSFGAVTPRVQRGAAKCTRTPHNLACGKRFAVTLLPLLALGVLLCLLAGPGGILAQAQVASPTIDAVTPRDGALAITWTAPTGVTGITAYDLRYIRSDAADKADANWTEIEDVWTSGAGTLIYTLTGLDNGVGYDVQLRTVTTSDGAWSGTSTGTPQIPGPVVTDVTAGDGALTVAWSAPAVAATTTVTAYDVRTIASSATDKADAHWTVVEGVWTSGSLNGVVAGLTNGTGYDVQVRAVAATDGAWSATSTGTPAEHGDTTATATTLTLGTPLGGTIDPGTDIDYFELVLDSAATILFWTSGDLDTVGELQDDGGMELESNDYGSIPEGQDNFVIGWAAQAGTYYVKVSSSDEATGAYVLRAVSIRDTTSTSNAITVSPHSSTLALVDRVTDNDYFKLTLAQETDLIIRTTGPVSKTSMEILDNRQSRIAGNRYGLLPPGETHALVRQSLAAGTYFIKISGLGIGGSHRPYTLHIRTVREPGDTTTDAVPLAFHQAEGGNIDPATDADYFRIDVAETTHIRLRAVSETVDIDGALLDSTGQSFEANFYEETLLDGDVMAFTLRRTLDAGTYYVQVTRSGGAETGPYTIVMVDDPALEALLDKCSGLDTTVSDPLFGCQWNLKNTGQLGGTAGEDINVEAAWAGGNLGAGITVVIVDNDMDLLHEDLTTDKSRSHKYELPLGSSDQSHATDVAGIVAARDNNLGIRGVAPRATIIGHAGYIPPSLVGNPPAFPDALTRNMEVAAVYNMSLGIPAGAAPVKAVQSWQTALQTGVTDGYGAKGVLYVVAAGNDASDGGNANLEEYQNSHHVTAVCAVNDLGQRTSYSEHGANLWVCASSNDPIRGRPGIYTTTNNSAYRDNFGGTSAAAPTVSGVAALVRAANPSLTWRDVKLILAASARKNDTTNADWEQGAFEYGSTTQKYDFNHEYGFGVVDASAAVTLASGWTTLPAFTQVTAEWDGAAAAIPDLPSSGTAVPLERMVGVGPGVEFTEFVEVDIEFVAVPSAKDVRQFRELEIELESPSGTVSVLSPAINDSVICVFDDPCGLEGDFRFGAAKHLGEDPEGEWKLRITDRKTGSTPGSLKSWALTVYGHRSTPAGPVIDSLTAGAESLTVTWSPPENIGASSITAYDVRSIRSDATDKSDDQWSVTDDAWTSTGGGDLKHTISGLTAGVQYDVQVRAVNAGGDGLWSIVSNGTPTTDESPTIDSVTPGNQSIAIAWTAPTNASLGTITAYDVRYIRSDASDKADTNWTEVSSIWTSGSLAYTLNPTSNPLVNGVSYDVQVRAAVGTVKHPWSGVHAATPRTTPGAPTIDTVRGADGALAVTWSAPSSDGGDSITSYDVRSIKTADDETDDANWTVETGVGSPGDMTVTVTGLDTGTQYDVQVRAVNGAGGGAWSATVTGATRPGAPSIDTVTGVVRGLTVKWSAPSADGDASVTSYDLRLIKTSADETVEGNWRVVTGVWNAGALTVMVTGLELGTQYDVQVRAVNASGSGPWSATRMGTTLLNDDASLSALTLTGVRLRPGFTSGTIPYTASVGYTVMHTTITATKNDGNATIAILDGNGNTLANAGMSQVGLSVGENIIRIRVTAQDGVTIRTYTVTVTRTEADRSLTPPASDPVAPYTSTAVYTVEFRGAWTTAATPDGLPGGAHFSRLIGAVHNAGVTFLEGGGTASAGVESMAEIGGTSTLRREVADAGPSALSVIQGDTDFIGTTTTKRHSITVTTDHPRVTLVTMIAPSPDWFIGVSGLSLLDGSGNWLSTREVSLYPWDAGTENGSGFSLSNPATSPRGVITSIRGTGKFSTEPIATLTFTLESVNYAPTGAPFITGVTGAPEVGEELTAHTTAIDDRNGLSSPGYEYQWLRVDSGGQAAIISGATSATYVVLGADVGRQLAVRVSFSDDGSTRETLTSDATAAIILTQVTVSFGASGYQAEEEGERAVVTVMLDKDPHRTLRIPLHAATGGGAGSPDFAAPTQVTFRPGETEKDVLVTAQDDSADDDGESVTLSFGDRPDGVSAGSPSETLVELIDNDYVPVTLGWEETAFTAEEPTSPGAMTGVTLRAVAVTAADKQPEIGFTFDFSLNTANGTARQPDDYEQFTATGTFDRGDFTRTTVDGQFRYVASAEYTVNVLYDTVDEPLERFTVRLAFAGASQPHLTLGEATATVTTTDDVASLADLQTTMTARSSAVEPGEELAYDWSVRNDGPAAATSTVVTGTLDAGVTFVSAQVSAPATVQCGRAGRTVTCTIGTLEAGDTASGEVVVRVNDDASADLGFTAVADADQLDRTPADNDASVTTALDAPPRGITDLQVTGGRRAIDLTWTPPGDNGSAITGYELERKAGTADFLPVFPQPPQGTTAYRDEDVLEGTEYTYRLRAVNEDGEGAWSNEPVARLLAAPPQDSGNVGQSSGGGGGGFGPAPVAPGFADGFRTMRELAGNASPSDGVGDPVAATHPDDLAITYSLSGADAASFTVDEETGQIRVKEGVELEPGRTYTVNLTATDSAGFGAIIIVTIDVVEATHHTYDLDRDGVIDRDEVIEAVKDYFDGDLSKEEVIELIKLYFAG